MPPRLIQLKAAAQMLGMSADDLNDVRSRNEIFGYRDGATWKFKFEEIERYAQSKGIEVAPEPAPKPEGGSGIDADLDELISVDDLDADESSSEEASSLGDVASILVSEEELGKSGGGPASTIIGKSGSDDAAADSDIQLAAEGGGGGGSDVELVPELDPSGSGVKLMPGGSDVLAAGSDIGGSNVLSDAQKADSPSATDKMEAADSDLSLGESGLALGDDDDLALGEDSLDLDGDEIGGAIDLDAVAAGSGAGSDVTGGAGDSGINLGNPSESGLSLEEEPLELGGSAVESLELGEDDMVPLEEEAADPDAATQLKADDDFLLTPVEDIGGEESDSGSQVIALDTEEFDESAEGLLTDEIGAEPLLEEEAAFATDEAGAGDALPLAGAAPLLQPKQAVEYPYSIWNVLSLMFIVLFLGFIGMMMIDLLRNMWSWDGTYAENSPIMDTIIEMISGK